jgi:hypothetical protein
LLDTKNAEEQQKIFRYPLRKVLLVCTGLLLVIILLMYFWHISVISAPLDVTKSYITALASGDAQTAIDNSLGEAAMSAARLKDVKEGNQTAVVDDISGKVLACKNGWAHVKVRVCLTLADGTADIGWYGIKLVKTGQGWRVVSFKENAPELSGTSFFVSQTDVQTAQQVFSDYLIALTQNDWPGATKCLAGPARRQQELSATVLGNAPIIKGAANLRVDGLWEKNKTMVCRAEYEIDGRKVSTIVTFALARKGEWKIVNIDQGGIS